ncbi:30S ribosomal protein S4e [archaeon]|jgi:small subunit ribosomal protein S4e|nr:30S ribosomal protein S4e [archaeon]MBT4397013.1 30S ribosomal protein S4e [archaeon]MBT4441004.1 30S ribosomal protein S4e [archaeon]
MVKNHLNRLVAPKSWPIRRKGVKFITRPDAGAHTLKEGIPLTLVIRDLLKYAKTTKEVKKILNDGKVLVNNKIRKNHTLNMGIMDILTIPELKESYVLYKDIKGKYKLAKIDEKESMNKLCKIQDKVTLKKGKIQLKFFNGYNLLIDKDVYKTGDTVIINLKENKIIKHLKFEKGASIYITEGNKVGMCGKLVEITELNKGRENVIFEVEGKKYETSKHYAFVKGDLKL